MSVEAECPTLILVTGLSGSGKSTAAKALEDIGFYCVDNLPLPLLRAFLADPKAQVGEAVNIALVTDVRAAGFADTMPDLLTDVDRRHFRFVNLFLEANEESLIRRFSETRRSHPLAEGDRPLIEGIRRERAMLADLRGQANLVFDTSDWSVHDVRREMYREFDQDVDVASRMVVSVVSFGFKYGIPAGSDLLFDVRFLPNPYFIPGLRELSGKDAAIQDYLDKEPDFKAMADRLEDFLRFLIPRYQKENRSYLSVAIGCTGGRHRSVAIVEELSQRLSGGPWIFRCRHRDCERRKPS